MPMVFSTCYVLETDDQLKILTSFHPPEPSQCTQVLTQPFNSSLAYVFKEEVIFEHKGSQSDKKYGGPPLMSLR